MNWSASDVSGFTQLAFFFTPNSVNSLLPEGVEAYFVYVINNIPQSDPQIHEVTLAK